MNLGRPLRIFENVPATAPLERGDESPAREPAAPSQPEPAVER
jgi:hypothetical protein